jgi:hypothetical protein
LPTVCSSRHLSRPKSTDEDKAPRHGDENDLDDLVNDHAFGASTVVREHDYDTQIGGNTPCRWRSQDKRATAAPDLVDRHFSAAEPNRL